MSGCRGVEPIFSTGIGKSGQLIRADGEGHGFVPGRFAGLVGNNARCGRRLRREREQEGVVDGVPIDQKIDRAIVAYAGPPIVTVADWVDWELVDDEAVFVHSKLPVVLRLALNGPPKPAETVTLTPY